MNNTFKAMNLKPDIEYIEMPDKLKEKYQYFTQATMDKIWAKGFGHKFHTLEEGVSDYVKFLKGAEK